jgi:hypothetical protein
MIRQPSPVRWECTELLKECLALLKDTKKQLLIWRRVSKKKGGKDDE